MMDTPKHIVVYGKAGCHLCDIAYELACGLAGQDAVHKVDITNDPELYANYHDKIPVLLVNQRVFLYAPIRAAEITKALSAPVQTILERIPG